MLRRIGFVLQLVGLLAVIEGEGGDEPSQLLGTLPSLPRGAYRLSWQSLSADDQHRTAGVLVSGVGREVDWTSPPLQRTRERLPDALAVLRSVGLPAAACISAVIVAGVYLTSSVVGSAFWACSTTHAYGVLQARLG